MGSLEDVDKKAGPKLYPPDGGSEEGVRARRSFAVDRHLATGEGPLHPACAAVGSPKKPP